MNCPQKARDSSSHIWSMTDVLRHLLRHGGTYKNGRKMYQLT